MLASNQPAKRDIIQLAIFFGSYLLKKGAVYSFGSSFLSELNLEKIHNNFCFNELQKDPEL
jgi:hypothetical protein